MKILSGTSQQCQPVIEIDDDDGKEVGSGMDDVEVKANGK